MRFARRTAIDLEGSLNSNATVGWRFKAMDGGFILLERQ